MVHNLNTCFVLSNFNIDPHLNLLYIIWDDQHWGDPLFQYNNEILTYVLFKLWSLCLWQKKFYKKIMKSWIVVSSLIEEQVTLHLDFVVWYPFLFSLNNFGSHFHFFLSSYLIQLKVGVGVGVIHVI